MKKLFFLLMILLAAATTQSGAQDRVYPNKPFKTLTSDPGYFTLNELSAGIGLGDTKPDYSKSFFGITTIEGYQFNKNMSGGLGTGALFYNGGVLIPLFIDFRYKFNLNPVTPYLYEETGALIMPSDFQNSKIFVTLGGGGQYAFTKKLAANFGLGLMVQSQTNRDTFITFKGGVTYMF
jgi:opacity protein-like surface antigen